jgi:hypothetical protein
LKTYAFDVAIATVDFSVIRGDLMLLLRVVFMAFT